jgi:rhodanese-related sulfurtransferase
MVRMMPMMLVIMMAFLTFVSAEDDPQLFLEPDEFWAGIQSGEYDAVIDVRTMEEWEAGHIANATLVENLASNGTAVDIVGCKTCTIAVYCRSGSRAGQAITRLQTEFGFTGATLYNAYGVSQWTDAGYPLVTMGESTTPLCALSTCESCRAECPVEEEDTAPAEDSGRVVSTAVASIAIPLIMVILTQL